VPVSWPDHVDEILDADLTAALGYVTPAGGTVVMAVAPVGLRDRERGTVGFTTSLGFSKKLERIKAEPRVALGYHARKHGGSDRSEFVLVQGRAEPVEKPSQEDRALVRRLAEARLGSAREGFFWDRWMREYYMVRIPVWVHVDRMTVWPDLRCEGEPEVYGEPPPAAAPAPQRPPAKGTGPRVDTAKAAKRLGKTSYLLLGHVAADAYPTVAPVELAGSDESGLELTAAPGVIPPGARRAGLVGHDYKPKLIGLTTRQHTGWLEAGNDRALYAPHTQTGFAAPPNKTLLLLGNGLQAKLGVRKARRAGALRPAGPSSSA
jgi:nitroimidazol reductase NimA-like FMN-containing flavoprotein (pyridoxamine 5'-phosphate oxidase superfamily)